ncbi:MAG TPA: hypothetical protein VGS19_30690 [Streptosporangiaceae bacterium]|nr:hypothetical protein [Streptosporangiaceae bacterium]
MAGEQKSGHSPGHDEPKVTAKARIVLAGFQISAAGLDLGFYAARSYC